MKIWVIQYHHRHGVDTWPVVSEDKPDLEEIENGLDDFEPETEEFVEAAGPFDLPDKPTNRTLNDTDISALTGADLLAIVEARKEDFIVYVGIQNKTCLSPDISHVTMNGQAIQINLETALLDNLSDEPWIKEAFQT